MHLVQEALPCIALLLTFACVLYCWSKRRFWAIARTFPGPPAYPLIGNALMFSGDMHETFNLVLEGYRKYGSISRCWIGPKLFIGLSDPEDIKMILGDPTIRNRGRIISKIIMYFTGNGLFVSSDDTWQLHRKLITPAFHFKIMETFVDVFARKAEILVENLKKVEGRTIDVYKALSLCTLDAICETVIGVAVNTQDSGENKLLEGLYGAVLMIQQRMVQPWLLFDTLFAMSPLGRRSKQTVQVLNTFSESVISKKLDEHRRGVRSPSITTSANKKVSSFLDMLLEESKAHGTILSAEDIRSEVNTLALAGQETTAATMSFLLILIALHPKVQAEVHKELDEVFGDDTRSATWDDVHNLPVLSRCIKETLRMFPIATLLPREIEKDVKVPSGYTIPAGCTAVVMSYVTHRNPHYYPEPESFWPDRWLPQNMVNTHPYAYLPFSAGPRICVGQKYALVQMKSVLSSLLREFTVTTPLTMDMLSNLNLSVTLTLNHDKGYLVQLNKRGRTAPN